MYHPQTKDFNYSVPQMDMNMNESHFDVPSAALNMTAIQPDTFDDVENQVATYAIQECIYFLPSDNNNFYHVTWKIISQQDSASSASSGYHDHEFFYDYDPFTVYYVTCKLIP